MTRHDLGFGRGLRGLPPLYQVRLGSVEETTCEARHRGVARELIAMVLRVLAEVEPAQHLSSEQNEESLSGIKPYWMQTGRLGLKTLIKKIRFIRLTCFHFEFLQDGCPL